MTELIILPGLDGTATMHSDFLVATGAAFGSAHVVSYPCDERLNYAELEYVARASLPDSAPFVLLGESFSGPIALSIAAAPPDNLLGLVLTTTFARFPNRFLSPLAAVAGAMPVRMAPRSLLSWFLLARWSTPEIEISLRNALKQVSPDVVRFRVATALRANLPNALLSSITLPVLYLRATHDRLLSPAAGRHLRSSLSNCEIVDIAGPHLLLQAAPAECARVVVDFAHRISSAEAR